MKNIVISLFFIVGLFQSLLLQADSKNLRRNIEPYELKEGAYYLITIADHVEGDLRFLNLIPVLIEVDPSGNWTIQWDEPSGFDAAPVELIVIEPHERSLTGRSFGGILFQTKDVQGGYYSTTIYTATLGNERHLSGRYATHYPSGRDARTGQFTLRKR